MWAVGIMLYEMITGGHPFYTGEESKGKHVEKIEELKYFDLMALPR